MTESTPSASSLKIRIRFDGAAPLIDAPVEETTLHWGRVTVALLIIIAAIIAIRSVMKSTLIESLAVPSVEVAVPAVGEITTPSQATIVIPEPVAHISTPSPNPTNHVLRAVLTDSLRKGQPLRESSGGLPVSDVTKRFYFFTEVQDVASRRFTHRWEYKGKAVAQIPFSTRRKNWTGSSSKQIPTHMQGVWRAVLVDDRGIELSSVAFTYGKELTAAQN